MTWDARVNCRADVAVCRVRAVVPWVVAFAEYSSGAGISHRVSVSMPMKDAYPGDKDKITSHCRSVGAVRFIAPTRNPVTSVAHSKTSTQPGRHAHPPHRR